MLCYSAKLNNSEGNKGKIFVETIYSYVFQF